MSGWLTGKKAAVGIAVVAIVLVAGVYAFPTKTKILVDKAVESLKDYNFDRKAIEWYVGNHSDITEAWLTWQNKPDALAYGVRLHSINASLHNLLVDAVDRNWTLFESVVRIPENINDYSWYRPSIDVIHLLGSRILSHPQLALESMIRGIEEKPRFGKDMTYLSVEPLVVVFEGQPYDKVLKYWPAVKSVCIQTEMVAETLRSQGHEHVLFFENGSLIPEAKLLLKELLDYQFNNEKGVLPMTEEIFDWFSEETAYYALGHSMGMNLAMFYFKVTIEALLYTSNWEFIKPPAVYWARYNIKNVFSDVPKEFIEKEMPLNTTGWKDEYAIKYFQKHGCSLKRDYEVEGRYFPNCWKYGEDYYDALYSTEYGRKVTLLIGNLYKIALEHGLAEDYIINGHETFVDVSPVYGAAFRIPFFGMMGNFPPPYSDFWHGYIGCSLPLEIRQLLEGINEDAHLLIDEKTQAFCSFWPTKEAINEDQMLGGVQIWDPIPNDVGGDPRTIYKP